MQEWPRVSDPTAAGSHKIAWLDDERVYITSPPTIIHFRTFEGAVRLALSGGDNSIRSDGSPKAISEQLRKFATGSHELDLVFRTALDCFVNDIELGPKKHDVLGERNRPHLARRLTRAAIQLLSRRVEHHDTMTTTHTAQLCAELELLITNLCNVTTKYQVALAPQLNQLVRPIRWIDSDTWVETILHGVDHFLLESAGSVEAGLARLQQVPRAPAQAINDPASNVAWIGWENGMLRTVEYDPNSQAYMSAAELRRIFKDHPNPKFASETSRGRLLSKLGIPRARVHSHTGWTGLYEI